MTTLNETGARRRRRSWRPEPLAAAIAALAMSAGVSACDKSGTGVGVAKTPGQPTRQVAFSWASGPEALSGDIATRLPDGETYRGRFLEIRSESVGSFDDYWDGWSWSGYGWDYGYGFDGSSWVTRYSGVVIASLSSPEGNTMRCVFQLEEPASGLAEGGLGQCKSSDGTTIENAILGPGDEASQRTRTSERPEP